LQSSVLSTWNIDFYGLMMYTSYEHTFAGCTIQINRYCCHMGDVVAVYV